MTTIKLHEILDKHKKWLNEEEGGERADLRGADLIGADLSDADLSGADLSDADLSGADLRGATLRGADLRRADLRGATLRCADLRGADLRRADLSDADLRDADLYGADLSDADLIGAKLDYSCLPLWCGSLTANMDESQVKQLLYHTLSIVKHSNNVSPILKEQLLTEQNLRIAKEFHRSKECYIL